MNTVFRQTELKEELKDLQRRVKELQSSRAGVLKSFQNKVNGDKNIELEELQLKIENVNWKLNSLF
jgi:uncharacterized protein YecE (DUF72 family)